LPIDETITDSSTVAEDSTTNDVVDDTTEEAENETESGFNPAVNWKPNAIKELPYTSSRVKLGEKLVVNFEG
jgi:hypothetical protein